MTSNKLLIIGLVCLNGLSLLDAVPRSFAARQTQYKVVGAPGGRDVADTAALESMLNKYAADGWELVLDNADGGAVGRQEFLCVQKIKLGPDSRPPLCQDE